jgi:hypothetical protein
MTLSSGPNILQNNNENQFTKAVNWFFNVSFLGNLLHEGFYFLISQLFVTADAF